MDFEPELDALFFEYLQNGKPAVSKILIPQIDIFLTCGGEKIQHVPNTAACKSIHSIDSQKLGSGGCFLHLLSTPLADSFRIPIPPEFF